EPGLEPLRQELLQTALEFYEHFVREGEGDPDVQDDLGRACLRLARLTDDIASKPRAEALARQALPIFDGLTRAHPEGAACRSGLADSYYDLGVLCQVSDQVAEAEAAHRQALGLREDLVRDHPRVPSYRSDLAYSHRMLANLYRDTARRDQAE